MAIRCPHCGSSVMIRGNRWECGWCGDFGALSSLPASERAKLDDTAPVTVTVMVTEPEEDSPKKLTPEELEVMVCGWDIVDNEDAIRDLLLAAFPEAASYVEADDLGAEELLGAAYEKNPDLAVEMWRKVLDVAQGHLQEPERAEYLLCDLMGDIWYGSISLWFILKAMKQDENFARQVFGSAYVGYPQEELLKVCDDSGETELKAKLTSLLEKNPHFKGFE
ncbi:hypothetical protein [Flavonifractor sp. An9]|uniref:hypothetical protein n=1 Tax=Flavonifractor sp. An9 TaxID=1965664 RepID=UPI001179A4DB|nr:hypothetical protein [Flavonifractor sp. An9]